MTLLDELKLRIIREEEIVNNKMNNFNNNNKIYMIIQINVKSK